MTELRRAWRLMAGQTLERREWDGEAVLFNDLTGATHLLSSTALWLLERLRTAPADSSALAAALEQELAAESAAEAAAEAAPARADHPDTDIDTDGIDPAQLTALLHDLHQMHLIEPC